MTQGIGTSTTSSTPSAAVWTKACQTLRSEFGESTFGSWLGQAALREGGSGELVLVAPTGFARDWIRRNAWKRISEVLSETDPQHRRLDLMCRSDFEADGARAETAPLPVVATAAEPISAPARPAMSRAPGLQERFTFDSFVPGAQNEFALFAARRVAAWKDPHFHTVLIHGPNGFGKTHLLNAIAWEAQAARPDLKVVYMPAERFLSAFVKAVMDRATQAFKEELRAADLLLIDDVHFIGGKPSSQEELLHTLTHLIEGGKRVVLSSDRAPSALGEVDNRLRSHLSCGLVCGIEAYDRGMRIAIIDRKLQILAERQGLRAEIKPDVLALVADRFAAGDVRELEGALNTLVFRAGADLGRMTVEDADAAIRPHLKGAERRITVDEIQKVVSEHYGMKQTDLVSDRRARVIARPRQVAMWLAKTMTTRSYPDIGRRFGGRDHTTVLHACRKVEELKLSDPQIAADVEALTRKLRG